MRANNSEASPPQGSKLGRISLLFALVIILLVVACIFALRWPGWGLAQAVAQSITWLWMVALLGNLLGMSIGIVSLARSSRNNRLGIAGVVLNFVVGTAVFIAPLLFFMGLFAYVFSHPVR